MAKTQQKPASSPVAVPPLPSIADLGRMLAVLSEEHDRLDGQNVRADAPADEIATKRRMDLITDRQWALRDLISALPAKTLADCVVQLDAANLLVAGIGSGARDQIDQDRRGKAIERITISVVPVLAAAAGLDLAELGIGEYPRLRATWFGEA